MKTKIAAIALAAVFGLTGIAVGQSHTSSSSGVHCDHFSKTGDTACYSRATGQPIGNSEGYSGQPLFQNQPSTSRVPYNGTIPSGNYNITGVQQTLNGRPHRNVLQLEPQWATDTYGRSAFRIHGGSSDGSRTASNGCIVTDRALRKTVTDGGAEGTLTVRPEYPQTYNYGLPGTMPRRTYGSQPRPMQSYDYHYSYGHH